MPPAKRKPTPKPAPKAAAKKPVAANATKAAATETIMSNDYGYALAFLKSDPTLYKVFQQALKETWTVDKFQAAVRNSPWYKKNGEAYRTNEALRHTDPATFKQNKGKMNQQVRARTLEMGTQLDPGSLNTIANDAMMFGWDGSQIDAAIKNQRFWKANSEAQRQYKTAKASDPKTFTANVAKMRTQVRAASNTLGAPLGAASVSKIADDAMQNGWDDNQISDAIRSQPEYQGSSDSERSNKTLKMIDPASYAANMAKAKASVNSAAQQMGAVLDPAELDALAESALTFGWDETQLNDNLAAHVESVDGAFGGQAADSYQSIANTLWRNGIRLPEETMSSYVTAISGGTQTVQTVQALIRKQAASLAPGYADELAAGIDLHDIAQPYMQSMAQTLEISPNDIDLFDPTITGALGARGADGKPTSKTLWEFGQDLRKDVRWRKTQGAQNETFAVANKVLSDFGLKS